MKKPLTINYSEEEFESKFNELDSLLLAFLCATEDGIFDENIVIEDYLKNPYSTKSKMIEEAKKAVKQAKEVLQLNPFPEALIGDLTNTISPIETRKEWLEKVVQKLQKRIEEFEKENNQ